MEIGDVDVEDDAFFADLSKQISLLIMDDDEEDSSTVHCPSLSLQVFSQTIHPTTQTSIMYEQQAWRRESKGTGVFIPRLSQPRRKNRHGRSHTKFHKQSSENSKGSSQHVACNTTTITATTTTSSYYDSFNYRRSQH